jgi:two-component sensor histidine kinase
MIRSELTAHAVRENQFAIRGPSLHLSAKAFESLALAVHELTTNALKFGALAYPGGHIDVSWSFDTAQTMPRLRLEWRESEVPIMPSSFRRGFGHELIERVLPYELHATTTIDFAQGGIRVTMDLPLNERTQGTSQPRDQKSLHANE